MNEVVSVIQAIINSTNPLSNPNQAVMTIHLVGLNAANGNTVWNKTIGYWRAQISGDIEQDIHECPVVKNGRIFALSNTGYNQTPADIVAINVTNGNQIWRQSFPQVKYQIQGGFMKYEPVILQKDAISDSLLFVSVGPTLYGLNTSTGAVTWSNSLPNGGNWIAKKYLDGRLYAFRMPLNQPMEIAAFEQTQSKPIPEIPVWFTTVSLTAAFFSAQLATVKRRTKRNCGAMRDFV